MPHFQKIKQFLSNRNSNSRFSNTNGNYIAVFHSLSTNPLERTEILLVSMQKHKWTVIVFPLLSGTQGVSDAA